MTKEENVITNILNVNTVEISPTENMTTYEVCKSINTVVSVIAFTIIIIFMFKFLKDTFRFKKV